MNDSNLPQGIATLLVSCLQSLAPSQERELCHRQDLDHRINEDTRTDHETILTMLALCSPNISISSCFCCHWVVLGAINSSPLWVSGKRSHHSIIWGSPQAKIVYVFLGGHSSGYVLNNYQHGWVIRDEQIEEKECYTCYNQALPKGPGYLCAKVRIGAFGAKSEWALRLRSLH